jgi:hypothetical protein
LQHGYASWHQSFAARLFFGEAPFFKEFHTESLASKKNRQSGPRDSATDNNNVGHLLALQMHSLLENDREFNAHLVLHLDGSPGNAYGRHPKIALLQLGKAFKVTVSEHHVDVHGRSSPM